MVALWPPDSMYSFIRHRLDAKRLVLVERVLLAQHACPPTAAVRDRQKVAWWKCDLWLHMAVVHLSAAAVNGCLTRGQRCGRACHLGRKIPSHSLPPDSWYAPRLTELHFLSVPRSTVALRGLVRGVGIPTAVPASGKMRVPGDVACLPLRGVRSVCVLPRGRRIWPRVYCGRNALNSILS